MFGWFNRAVMLQVITLALVAGVSGNLFAGGSSEKPDESEKRPDFRVGVERLPDGFAPSLNVSNVGQRINHSIYDHFVKRAYWSNTEGNGGELAPSLAESWEQVSPTIWEFTIRKGVKFHNGDELTAEDIEFNFSEERMWGDNPTIARGPSFFGTISSVEVTGPYTIRFETTEPDPAFANRFTMALGYVVPKDYYEELDLDQEEFNLAPVGTGPYRFVSYEPDEYVRLEAFDEYWGGTPNAASVTFYEIPEAAGRLSALFNGEIDLIANVSPDLLSTIENRDGFEVRDVLIDNYRNVSMNTVDPKNPQMKDRLIRQALAHAIDREIIVNELWKGYSTLPKATGLYPGHDKFYLDEYKPFPYDPERARELLDEAGYDGEEFLFAINGGYYTNYLESGQIMQEMWEELGINVRIEIRESNLVQDPYDMRSWSDGMQMTDPVHPIWVNYGPTGNRANERSRTRIWSPTEEFRELGTIINTETDFEKRRAAFEQLIGHFENEMISFPLFQAVEFYATRSDIEWQPYSFWPMDFGPENLSFPEK